MSADLANKPETARLFFALWPTPALAAELAELAQAVAVQSGGQPTRQASMHLTLAFLGAVPVTQLPLLADIARQIKAPSFDLSLDCCAYWPRQQLTWAGCKAPPAALLHLAADLHSALALAGFIKPHRAGGFRPHVTLLRKALAAPAPDFSPRPAIWSCTQFVLVRSQQSSAGSAYQQLVTFPLPS